MSAAISEGARIQEYYMTPSVFQKLYGSPPKPDEVERINGALRPKWPQILHDIWNPRTNPIQSLTPPLLLPYFPNRRRN